MANNILFDNPPILQGKAENQLQQIYGYLFNVSNQLNSAMMSIEIRQQKAEEQTKTAAAEEEQNQANTDFIKAKSLIIKTAELVRTEMEEIRARLSGSIEALSEQFGTYQQTITNEITATTNGILQELQIREKIEGVEGQISDFISSYESYIFAGLVDPINNRSGIAIGESLIDSNGNLIPEHQVVRITTDRISFFQSGTEVSYFSNNQFYIAKGVVTDSMQMGNFIWKPFSNGSLGLMKV